MADLSVGSVAPSFELPDQQDHPWSLSGQLEVSPVVLVFYPGDNTPVCTRQLTTYTTEADQFADVEAQILALSPQGIESHQSFADSQGGFAFPLLADIDALSVNLISGFELDLETAVTPTGTDVEQRRCAMWGPVASPQLVVAEARRSETLQLFARPVVGRHIFHRLYAEAVARAVAGAGIG